MLLYKMLSKNIDGKFYNSVKSLLTNTVSSVTLNGKLTDWFLVSSGRPELTDLLCLLYKRPNWRIKDFYADDILILSENEADMQNMLDYIQNWCRKWRLLINKTKTNVMYFRNKGRERSNFEFSLSGSVLNFTRVYKYSW